MAEVVNKILRGTFGKIWVNGELFANVKSFECKATMSYETVDVSNEMCEQNRYVGYALAGTLVLHKINDKIAAMLVNGIKTGSLPEIKMVGALSDPDVEGAERIEIYNVTLDEVMLMQFENKAIGEESVPFKAGGFNYLDLIQ